MHEGISIADSKTVSELVRPISDGWVTDEAYPKMGEGVSHPTHMDIIMKQLELGVYGVRITANMGAQAEREEPYRMSE